MDKSHVMELFQIRSLDVNRHCDFQKDVNGSQVQMIDDFVHVIG